MTPTPLRSTPQPGGPYDLLFSRRTLVCAIVLILGVWFLTLDARHLLRSDEGRYAEIAREMFATGDWVTIRYNGLKYFEKPPFHLWMTATAYHVFGVGDWQARLWVAVSGIIGLLMTSLAASRWYGRRVGLLTALVLLSAPTWNLGSHFNSLDMSVSGALACVLAGVLLAQHPDASQKTRRHWMLFAWAAMGVAVLTKGLIGIVLPGMVLFVYMLVARDWKLLRRLYLPSGALCFAVITVPWFVLVSMRNPAFPQFFFIHEHWQRYTSTVHQRNAPVWYFVPQLIAGFLPWIGLVPAMLRQVRAEPAAGGFRPLLLLSVWAVVIFGFFSLSSSKLPGYIIPVFPALAIIAARALAELTGKSWRRQLIGMLVVVGLGLVASPLVARVGAGNATGPLYAQYAVWVAIACAAALAGIAIAFRLNQRGATLHSIALTSVALFVAATIALCGNETVGRASSGVDLVGPIEKVLEPGLPIYSVRLLDHTLPFYLRRTMVMVESADELEFGTTQEPDKWIPTLAGFIARWSDGTHAIAVMSHETYATLQGEGAKMTPIAQDARRVVVANFQPPSR